MAYSVIIPKLTDLMEEGRILEWLCSEGEVVSLGRPLFVVETDKAVTEVLAERAGTLRKILVQAGTDVPVGTPVAWIADPGEILPRSEPMVAVQAVAPSVEAKPATGLAKVPRHPETEDRVAASPIARRLARELAVDLKSVRDRVGQKRITEADVRAYAHEQRSPTHLPGVGASSAAEPDVGFTVVQPTPLERTMAARLSASAAVPQYAAVCDVDLTNLERLRHELLPSWEASYGFRLTYTHILAALVSRVLEQHPALNASWTTDGIRLYRTVNLGVAMATQRGLVVPVVHGANELSLAGIADEIMRLQQAAETNRLQHDDLHGGTFTLTNVGMMGVTLSIPVLNPPQSGILAIAAKRDSVVLENGELRSRPVMAVTLVADHRLVDGATGAAFLRQVKEHVENPGPILSATERKGSAPEDA